MNLLDLILVRLELGQYSIMYPCFICFVCLVNFV